MKHRQLLKSSRQASFSSQSGQALVEGVIALLVLMSLWVGVAWLARLQDMALQASHASRYAAFAISRNPHADMENEVRQHYFSGPAHQWSDRSGKRLLGPGLDEVALLNSRNTILPEHAQAGGAARYAQTLRQDWRLNDTGISDSQITVAPLSTQPSRFKGAPADGLSHFDSQRLVLRRHTAILTGAGHAGGDTAAQQRVAASSVAWAHSANMSYAGGAKVAEAMVPVEAGWNRTKPVLDWLEPWAGRVPESHLGK